MVPVFATASLLGALAVVTLVVKTFIEWRYRDELAAERRGAG
jgi:sulfate transport system permease protein